MAKRRITFALTAKGSIRAANVFVDMAALQVLPDEPRHIYLEPRPERYMLDVLVVGHRTSTFELKITLAGGKDLVKPLKGTITSARGYPIIHSFVLGDS